MLSVLLTVLADVLLTRRKSRARQRRPEAEPQPAADHNREEDEKIEVNGGPEDASAEPSIRRGANGLPDTLSVSAWVRAQSEAAAGPNPAHPPNEVAADEGAPVAEGASTPHDDSAARRDIYLDRFSATPRGSQTPRTDTMAARVPLPADSDPADAMWFRAGPLKSNGSPAKVIAVLFFGLALLGFILVRRTASTRTVRPGVVIILLYFLLQLAVYGVGLTHLGSALVEANKTRALINLVANVGVALYIITRVRTTRQRNIVLGCLATGLTFACLVGLLQSLTNIDLRFFFQPPGFVINTEYLEIDERWGAKRVVGTSTHAIEFSVLAAVTVPLTIYFARNAAKRQVRLAAVLACGLALVAMPAAVSRTGVIALVAALLVYMWNFKVRQLVLGVGRRVGHGSQLRHCLSKHGPCTMDHDRRRGGRRQHPDADRGLCRGVTRPSAIIRCSASDSAERRLPNTASSTMNGYRQLFRAAPSASRQ